MHPGSATSLDEPAPTQGDYVGVARRDGDSRKNPQCSPPISGAGRVPHDLARDGAGSCPLGLVHEPVRFLVDLGYPVEQVLPLPADSTAAQKELGFPVDEAASREDEEALSAGYVAFEWIGLPNYLRERLYGRVASDASRGRGKGFTSADFAFRFRRTDGRIQVTLGEWKYTEFYENGKSLRYGKKRAHGARTGRTSVCGRALESRGCQIRLGSSLSLADLMYDPFDQILRDQSLASAMEQAREMEADIVSYLHVAPKANRELVNRITAPALRGRGDEIHEVWRTLAIQQG